jgi:hypothetical protein
MKRAGCCANVPVPVDEPNPNRFATATQGTAESRGASIQGEAKAAAPHSSTKPGTQRLTTLRVIPHGKSRTVRAHEQLKNDNL